MMSIMWVAMLVGSAGALERQRLPRLDGCRYVFLDLGSNIGIHARFLFEPELYPNQKYTSLFFDAYFPRENRIKRSDICVVGFEPNPNHRKRLERLQQYYTSKGLRCYWIFAGVGDKNSQRSFLRAKDKRNMYNSEWGFRAISPSERRYKLKTNHSSLTNANEEIEELEIIRLADFLESNVVNRDVPGKLLASDPSPAVIAKMDIEMEEFAVLNDLLKGDASLFCALSMISIEFHYYNRKSRQVATIPKGPAQVHFPELVKVKQLIEQANEQHHCKTKVVQFDSEDYRRDTEEGIQLLSRGS